MRILIADDDRSHREIVRRILARLGDFELIEAESGSDTFLKANLERPDLILLDWMMPFRDGVTILKDLRQNGIDTPVILITAKADEKSRGRALDAGAATVITKPYTLASLREQLRPFLFPDEPAQRPS